MPRCIVAQNAARASMSAFRAEFITHLPLALPRLPTLAASHSLLSHFKLPARPIVRSRSHEMLAFPSFFFLPTLCVMERPRVFFSFFLFHRRPAHVGSCWISSSSACVRARMCVFRRATCVELSHSLYAFHPGNSLITKCVRSLDVCSLMCRDV